MAEQVVKEKIWKGIKNAKGGNVISFYEECADEYELDHKMVGYTDNQPREGARLLMGYLSNSKEESCLVLDLCAGTGLVGEYLRQMGFKGILDGVDGSKRMLEIAKRKNVYQELYVEYLEITKGIQSGKRKKYDALICIGALGPNHLDAAFLAAFPRRVKSGGIIMFSIRLGTDQHERNDEVEKEIGKMVESGLIEEVAVDATTFYTVSYNTTDPDRTPGTIYCYRKL